MWDCRLRGRVRTRVGGSDECAQAHRGPDGRGLFEDPGAEGRSGHVRLAILDLTDHAAQPMHALDGRHVLVYNGELYNFAGAPPGTARPWPDADLHRRHRGPAPERSRNTGVLSGATQRHVAFALWDRRERELLLVRDPLGIKPLYYAEPELGRTVFASEIKAFAPTPRSADNPISRPCTRHRAYRHASGEPHRPARDQAAAPRLLAPLAGRHASLRSGPTGGPAMMRRRSPRGIGIRDG